MNIFHRLGLLFRYGPELDELLKERRKELQRKAQEAEEHNLQLCQKHKQEKYHSEYASRNCDYCRLLAKYEALQKRLR